jgi:glucose-6-phosphate 1-dehydrogenase
MEAWRIVDRVLSDRRPVRPYPVGSWGPDQANAVLGSDWRWITP